MAGLLGMALAGGLAGGGAAAEDYYRRNDQFDLQRQLMEQQQRWQADREVAMEKMRQSGALNMAGVQQGYAIERDNLQQAGQDRRQAAQLDYGRSEGAASRENQMGIAILGRESAERIAGGQLALSAAQLENTRNYQDRYLGLLEDRNGARLPAGVQAQFSSIEKALDDVRGQIKSVDDAMLKPEVAMNPEMLKRIDAQKAGLIKQQRDLQRDQTRLLFNAGVIKEDDLVSRAAGRFQTLDDVNGWVRQVGSELGGDASQRVAAALERAGIPQRIGSRQPQAEMGPPSSAANPAPTRNSGPLGGILTPYTGRQDNRPGFANDVQLTPAERLMQEEYDAQRQQSRTTRPNINVETASIEELREALNNGSLSGRQMARARARLSGR